MTVFGIDVSHYQATLHLSNVKAQGFEFVAAKCTEGAGYADPAYDSYRRQADALGLLFCAYHFLRSDASATAQAENLAKHIGDKSIPVMIDCEPSGDSKPTLRHATAFKNACAKRGVQVSLLYFPHFWWDETGRPSLQGWALWQASYGTNPAGYASKVYPGDHSTRWSSQGGVVPGILQFGSLGKIDGFKGTVDVDAFRGTRAQLAAKHWFKDFGEDHQPNTNKTPQPAVPDPQPAAAHPADVALAANHAYAVSIRHLKGHLTRRLAILAALRSHRKALTKWSKK